ncbi:MAG: alpha-E domain-containing protein, partial [Limibacillus sp.]
SGAGYHAFRRVQPRGMKAPDVAGFFLFDHAFPRSMTTSLAELDGVFTQLNEEYQLERGGEVAQVMGEIHEAMSAMARETYWDESLHWRMDHIQLLTGKLSNAIARRFFGQDA